MPKSALDIIKNTNQGTQPSPALNCTLHWAVTSRHSGTSRHLLNALHVPDTEIQKT